MEESVQQAQANIARLLNLSKEQKTVIGEQENVIDGLKSQNTALKSQKEEQDKKVQEQDKKVAELQEQQRALQTRSSSALLAQKKLVDERGKEIRRLQEALDNEKAGRTQEQAKVKEQLQVITQLRNDIENFEKTKKDMQDQAEKKANRTLNIRIA